MACKNARAFGHNDPLYLFLISEATAKTVIKKVPVVSRCHHCWMRPIPWPEMNQWLGEFSLEFPQSKLPQIVSEFKARQTSCLKISVLLRLHLRDDFCNNPSQG